MNNHKFYFARPPKEWELKFEMKDDEGTPIELDASAWRCVLLNFTDGVHECMVCKGISDFGIERPCSPIGLPLCQ